MSNTYIISQPPGEPAALFKMLMSQAHPKECALREMVQNAIEANMLSAAQCFEAGDDTHYAGPSEVLVTRWANDRNKVCFVNTGGVYLDERIMSEHLLTFGSSGTSEDQNFGLGGKYSAFKYFPVIRYISKRAGDDFGVQYTIDATGDSKKELVTTVEDVDMSAFGHLSQEQGGTECIFLGRPDQLTYDELHECFLVRNTGHTGNGFLKALRGRYAHPYVDAYGNEVRVVVDIFKKGSTTQINAAKALVNGQMVVQVLDHPLVERFADFSITVGPYAGATVSVGILPNQEGKKKNPLTNTMTHGGLIFVRQNEAYNKNRQGKADKKSYIPEVRACGFGALDEDLVKDIVVVVDLTTYLNVVPTGDRLWLSDEARLVLSTPFDWKSVADNVAESLSDEVKDYIAAKGNEDESDDIAMQREMLKMIEEMYYGGGARARTSPTNNKKSGASSSSGSNATSSPRNLIGSNPHNSRGTMRPLPVRPGNYGPSEPLVRIGRDPIEGWCTFYNYDSGYHAYRSDVIVRDNKVSKLVKKVDKNVIDVDDIISRGMVWVTALEVMRSYIETAKVEMPGVKLADVIDLLTPERLQSSFQPASFVSNVAKRLRKKA